ncbi:GatB/YqeY domain-containing protein [Gilvimarinus polysaccharolyticus]|uniref:GatB/YqeY domain-containing protein n=1 Tax=Gilvimarinus polysaccharolyticus TaxID=863921 RepID=UPI00067361EB|nr:GatB/YqeY domain-containing protein [Gilvimarinus polysaccharolyticus]
MAASAMKTRINDELKTAMRAKEKARVAVLRLVMSEFKRIEVDERVELDDARILVVLDKMLKQRRDSIAQFDDAGRTELADQERSEIVIIQEFMPQPLSAAELDDIITKAVSQSGASEMRDMGKVMGLIKPQVQGRADMGDVSRRIKASLG